MSGPDLFGGDASGGRHAGADASGGRHVGADASDVRHVVEASDVRHVVVEADGGSRGNPGPAGYGAAVTDADTGVVLAERFESIGTATNNVAEYRGLIAGLEAAAELGAASVAVRMDSRLVVEQMRGTWQVKHPDMRPLARRAQELRRHFNTVTFEWIPRERNKHADALANRAMDAAAGRSPKRAPGSSAPGSVPSGSSAPGSRVSARGAELARRVDAACRLSGRFTLRSGEEASEYFDKYRFEADPALLRDVAAGMQALLPRGEAALAGLELGGVPLATVLGQLSGRPLRFVRKQAKAYGTGELVEGGPVDGQRLVIVEDVVTTGAAVLVAAAALREAGATVTHVACAIDREGGAAEALADAGLTLKSLFTRTDLDTAAAAS